MGPRQVIVYLATLAGLWTVAALPLAQAQRGDSTDLQAERRMVFVASDGGMSTFKSELVEQNDTGMVLTYVLGATVGDEKTMEFRIRTDSSTIPFALNNSSITSKWQDTLVLYHFPYFNIGAGLGSNAMTVVQDAATTLDIVGTGFGAAGGLVYPITRAARVSLNAIFMSISSARELEQRTVSFGARTDMDFNVTYDLTKTYFDLVYGYRYRTYSMTTDTTTAAETHTSTYAGLQFGFDL